MFRYQFINGEQSNFPVGKAVCVGRNYADHIAELNNETPEEPLLFIKGSNAIVDMHEDIVIPKNIVMQKKSECHNELELVLLIGSPLTQASEEEAIAAVAGVGLALDLTLREVQNQLKQKGYPWERAKAFDGSCPVSHFLKPQDVDLKSHFTFQLKVNEQIRQQGQTQKMLWSWPKLIAHISETFSLCPGDLVLTGTPKGVGRLDVGDKISVDLDQQLQFATRVV